MTKYVDYFELNVATTWKQANDRPKHYLNTYPSCLYECVKLEKKFYCHCVKIYTNY